MSRINSAFSQPGHKALIPYVTIGYPSIEATLEVVPLMADHGCDIIELGIPFSDPLADGVTIQKASFDALEKGVTPQLCLEIAKQLRQRVSTPLIFMTYFNPIFTYGLKEFCSACSTSGIDGLIIPDLPLEEGSELETIMRRQNLDLIYLLSPASTDQRVRLVAERARGFIYLVSIMGVTGARDTLSADIGTFINRVRQIANQPLCVGFGISNPKQAKQVARIADGVIVGSQIIRLMESQDNFMPIVNLIADLRQALDKTTS
jgi:tryptophan synthase alpha chain